MSGFLVFTCPRCQTMVDYSCMCEEVRPISKLVGHSTVSAAKAHLDKSKPKPTAA